MLSSSPKEFLEFCHLIYLLKLSLANLDFCWPCIVVYPYSMKQQDFCQQPVNINPWHIPTAVYTE